MPSYPLFKINSKIVPYLCLGHPHIFQVSQTKCCVHLFPVSAICPSHPIHYDGWVDGTVVSYSGSFGFKSQLWNWLSWL